MTADAAMPFVSPRSSTSSFGDRRRHDRSAYMSRMGWGFGPRLALTTSTIVPSKYGER